MNIVNFEGIGPKITHLRKEMGYTMRDLSDYTGLSIGLLSSLEGGKNMNPTLESLQRIASALQVDIVDLITDKKERKFVIRKNETKNWNYEEYRMKRDIVDFGYDRDVYERIVIGPNAPKKGALSKHLYAEICMVQSGELTVEIENEPYTLYEGDSIYIEERKEHRIYNAGNENSISIWVHHKK